MQKLENSRAPSGISASLQQGVKGEEEWDQGDLFVTDFARNGEVLFAA